VSPAQAVAVQLQDLCRLQLVPVIKVTIVPKVELTTLIPALLALSVVTELEKKI